MKFEGFLDFSNFFLVNFITRSQTSRLLEVYGLSPEWVLSCFFKLFACVNFLPHLEQMNGLSPVWILSCLLKALDCEHL